MKKVLFLCLSVLLLNTVNAQFSKASLQATGLTCAMCSNAINKALQKVPFVESVKSDIKNSAFNIVFKQEAAIDIDALKTAVEDAGFSVGSLKLTGNFNGTRVANDAHVQIGNSVFHFLETKEQVLNGEATITLLDKSFVTAKQFKKVLTLSKKECVQTGKASGCCAKEGVAEGARVYHVTVTG